MIYPIWRPEPPAKPMNIVSIGYSMLIDPLGTVLRALGTAPATATLDLSPDAVEAAREQFPTWAHHRLL